VVDTNASLALASGVQLVEVEVDMRLGKIRATRSWSGIHAGVIRQPVLARSQVKGGVIQGLGYALYEERLIDPGTGRLATHNLEDYRIPGMGDIPEMEVHFDEGGFETVPGRSVGIAELATVSVAGALANAVFHATGWRPMQLPLRADRVLQGVKA
jgi:xanthine dehydrogenase YagR molybdenum-binding subunit